MIAERVRCVFRLRCGRARDVFLLGEFNNWSTTATRMERNDAGRWEASLDLLPGDYRYCYLVLEDDGRPGLPPLSIVNDGSSVSVPIPAGRPAPGEHSEHLLN